MNTQPVKDSQPNKTLSEEAVVEYLRQHPDFFARHRTLLTTMKIPSTSSNKVVQWGEGKTVVALRKENQQLQDKLDVLVTIAKDNSQLHQRIQRLVAALTNITGIDDFFRTLYSTLCNEFNTDTVVIRWFEAPSRPLMERLEFVEYDAQVFTLFEHLLESGQPICGEIGAEQIDYLFPNSKIASAVLIPLGRPKPQGLLAMGSHDPSRFHADMGIDFLKYLGELVSHLLKLRLQLSYYIEK